MKWFFRPLMLVALGGALFAAAVVVFRARPAQVRPQPSPVAEGEYEIVWLYGATNVAPWERFVAAVERAKKQLQDDFPGLEAQTEGAFPEQTTAVPEVALYWPKAKKRLVFRWYKLTSDWKTRDWVDALTHRQPPPLAIIGGNTSDGARDLAYRLKQLSAELPAAARPLLLLTTATADEVAPEEGVEDPGKFLADHVGPRPVPLTGVYPERTFRFCFTNAQMAAAVTQFIASRDDLRPDSDPYYLVKWEDDAYSRDLMEKGFWNALGRYLFAPAAVRDWGALTGGTATGSPLPVSLSGIAFAREGAAQGRTHWLAHAVAAQGVVSPSPGAIVFPQAVAAPGVAALDASPTGAGPHGFGYKPPTWQTIDSSVGTFLQPNRYEAQVARELLDELLKQAGSRTQRRPLLVVTGQSAPSRRFLHALARTSPDQARRFVVATGDGISFNTVYRDRQVAWPIQDLPFHLVFFCHHNPIDADADFRPVEAVQDPSEELGNTAATGTEDVLLYSAIVEAVAHAFRRDHQPCAHAGELAERLTAIRLRDGRISFDAGGQPFFSPDGNRLTGTGEHVVYLRPCFEGRYILRQSTIEVWAWRQSGGEEPPWRRVGDPLTVRYDADISLEGGRHGSE
jgi:hypothetical protein